MEEVIINLMVYIRYSSYILGSLHLLEDDHCETLALFGSQSHLSVV